MAIVEDVVQLLVDEGTLGTIGTDIFGYEWGTSDEQILVMLGTATPSDLKDLYATDAVQILVRGQRVKSAKTAYATANKIYNYLVGLSENTIVNDNRYKGFEPSSNIAPLGKDENERHLFSLNFETVRGLN